MKRFPIWFGLIALVVLGQLLSPARTEAATATNLQTRVSKGQTFLTFTQVSGTGITYNVYRSTSPITSVSGLTPIAVLPDDSGKNRYTGQNFVICDLCQPLPSNTGFLVWTTKTSGNYYYAVTNSQSTDLTTSNTIGPVAETFSDTPGAVLLGTASNVGGGAHTQYRYMAWEDCANWRHNSWGYYGHRFDVYVPESVWGMKPPYPLILQLHAAGDNGYHEPYTFTNTALGVIIHPMDLNYIHGLTDPYSGVGYPHSKWFGRFDSITDTVKTVTEDRVVRYTKLVRDNPIFQIDPMRVYVTGASLGSGAMHVASHNSAIFAAAAASIGWINDDAWLSNAPQNTTTKVNSANGPLWKDYQDMAWMAQQVNMIPIVHTFNKDDSTISPAAYPGTLQIFENNKQPYVAKWQNGNHTQFGLSGAWDYKRFKKDEAYPAFALASNSDPFSIQEGQRNVNLDWSSSLRDFNTASSANDIVDTLDTFGMSFRSLTTDATATVSIHNAQIFRPSPGEVITWANASQTSGQTIQSGTIQADSRGLLTLTMQILAAGNRLTLSRSPLPLPLQPPAAPSGLLVQ